MLATEKTLEGGFGGEGGRSRGGEHLHWLCRLPDGRLLEMPFPQGLTGVAISACRGPTRRQDRVALERSSGVLRHPTAGDRHDAETIPKRSFRFVFSRMDPFYDALLLDLAFRT